MSDSQWEEERARALRRTSREFPDGPQDRTARWIWGGAVGLCFGFAVSLWWQWPAAPLPFLTWMCAWAVGTGGLFVLLKDQIWYRARGAWRAWVTVCILLWFVWLILR